MIEPSLLRNYPFFQEFRESDLAALTSIGSTSQWGEGEILFESGTTAKHLYILASGAILLCFSDGRSFVVEDEGHAIGWSSFVSPFRYTARAVCLTDATLYRFPGADVYQLIQMDADFGRRLMQKIALIMETRAPYLRKKRRS